MTDIRTSIVSAPKTSYRLNMKSRMQSMRNLVCRRSTTGKTCLRLVVILGLPVTMTGNFCQILLYIQ